MDAGLKNVSLSNFHGVAVRNATIYGKYFPTHTGSKPPPPKRARSRSANLHIAARRKSVVDRSLSRGSTEKREALVSLVPVVPATRSLGQLDAMMKTFEKKTRQLVQSY